MRITRIQVQRFMGLRKLDIDIDPQLQLIAGPNNAGKTTLLRAIEFFFNPKALDHERFKPKNAYYTDEGPRALTRVRVVFGQLDPDEKHTFAPAILARSSEMWLEVRSSRKGTLGYAASKEAPAKELHKEVTDRFKVIHVPAVRIDRAGTGAADSKRLAATVRDVLVQTRTGRSTDIQRRFREKAEELLSFPKDVLVNSKEAVSGFILPGVEIEFSLPDESALLESALRHIEIRPRAGTDIELRDEGTGIQSLLSLGVLKYVSMRAPDRSHLLLIEEPEAFLHPQLQRVVADHLTDLSDRSQVLATTHSPTIADKIDINRISRLARDPAGLSQEWRPERLTETSAGRLSKYCDTKNSELIFASHVVLAEGGSDVGVIENLLQDSRGARGISIINMGGADHADHFVQLATRFQVPYLVVLDKDKYVKDRNTIKKISRIADSPLTSSELNRLAQLGSRHCVNYEQAEAVRDEANGILRSRGIFALSSDMEGSTVTSLRKGSVIEILGPSDIGHLTEHECRKLQALSGGRYRQRIWQLTGSKGWNSTEMPEKGKPKPHVLPNLVAQATGKFVQRSDLLALREKLLRFVQESDADTTGSP